MGHLVGIDLGTTNSVVASAEGASPQVLVDKNNRSQFRSVVSLKKRKSKKGGDDTGGAPEILVGDVALDNWPMAPTDTIVSIKRLMGRAVVDPEVEKVKRGFLYKVVQPSDGTRDGVRVVMGDKEYSPVEISALILRCAKEFAEFRLGGEVTHAVITVPAYFSQKQKSATRQAGLLAGLQVIQILDEPTAAAVAFGVDNAKSSEAKCILVYDLGGGTFDISILMWAGNLFSQINLEGDMWLGGDNFDQVLIDHAIQYIKEEYEMDPVTDMRFMVELRKAARETKERLSTSRSADLVVASLLKDADGDIIDVVMEVTREQYEAMIRPLVDRATALVEKALANADLKPDQVDHVLMAGNCTCIPLVQESMEKLFGKDKILRNVHPKNCVALGAAIVAARRGAQVICQAPDPANPERECGRVNKDEATVCEKCGAELSLRKGQDDVGLVVGEEGVVCHGIAPFSYGAQTAGDTYNVYIKKNDQVPTPESDRMTLTFYTRQPNQRMIAIPVYGGDNLEKASANEKQGEAFAVLPPGLPKGAPVRIRIWLNSNGIFELAAFLEDGTNLEPLVLEGYKDQKAVEKIEEVEAAFHEESLDPEKRARLEQARNEAFNRLKRKDYEGALEQARRVNEIADESEQADQSDALKAKCDGLVNFTQFVLQEYSWALPAERVYEMNKLLEEVRQALQGGDQVALKQKCEQLDTATNKLPQIVNVLMGVRGAINTRIRPIDPEKAQELFEELERIEQGLKSNSSAAKGQFEAFLKKLTQVIEAMPKAVVQKCPDCGAPTQGKRICPNGHDTWIPTAKSGVQSSGIGGISSL